MKKVLYYLEIIIICAVVWVILNENLSLATIMAGGALGLLSVLITDHLLLLTDYKSTYQLQPTVMIKYVLYLIYQIYFSGFTTIIKIISGKISPGIVEIETELDSDLYISMLANSITLTPGTVTIDKKGRKLVILWLNCVTKDSKKAGKIIKGNFEKILLKG
ncbi:MAG: Na+/H+ antiporter subunit E [Firmicutes bacterium]|nr:Na+/H+ antiporter subunit E [Bacillota bacterium]